MRVLLVSTYELGHQPLHVASPAAALTQAGHDVDCMDISVEDWDPQRVERADAVAFSVPMHTAMRLAVAAAGTVKRRRPAMPVAFYGLYALVSRDRTLGPLADRLIAGEYERELVSWLEEVASSKRPPEPRAVVNLEREAKLLPVRDALPPLDRYAHLDHGDRHVPAGYVEATHGCAYHCKHCPVPTIYDGRTRRVPLEVILSDIERQVAAGAQHITFGDPDFLNRFRYAIEVVEAVHERFPDLTYDVTTKVEHVLKHRDLLPDLARTGCLFAVSAFETTNDRILEILDKGHTSDEMAQAVGLLREHGIEPRPSWMPFTPWTTLDDLVDILDFVVRHDLVDNVDPVQYSIRLLVPEGSLLLDSPAMQRHLGAYDAERLTYTWTPADAETDRVQRELAARVERDAEAEASGVETFLRIRELVWDAAGVQREAIPVGSTEGRPRLTEPWFC